MKGTYLLEAELASDAVIRVGALGIIRFRQGKYVYVGSALNSLEKRIERHFRKEKKKHWHIDYFLSSPKVCLEKAYFMESRSRKECIAAKKVSASGVSVKGFGCSDCRCESHLFRVEKMPRVKGFREYR